MVLPRAREGYDEERSHSSQTVFSVLVTIFTSRLLYSITCVKCNGDILKYHTHTHKELTNSNSNFSGSSRI